MIKSDHENLTFRALVKRISNDDSLPPHKRHDVASGLRSFVKKMHLPIDTPVPPAPELRKMIACQSAFKRDPRSACKKDPWVMLDGLVQVANRRAPRARGARFKCAGVAGAWEVPVCPPGQARGWGPGRGFDQARPVRRGRFRRGF